MNRIDRLTGMILLLQGQRVITAEQIAEHFEMSVRTVYRDLAALGEAGVPIIAEAGVGYSLMRGYHMPPIMFTEDEAAALFLSGQVTEQIADDSLRQALRGALLKVKSVLPQEKRDYVRRLRDTVGVRLRGNECLAGHAALMPMQDAVARRRCLAITYNTANRGALTERVVEPLGLVYYARQWHLLAWCRWRQEARDFRLDRIGAWQVLEECYQGHENFSVKEFLGDCIARRELVPATLIVHLHARERLLSEQPVTPVSQETLADGRVRLEVLTFSLEWLGQGLLGFGVRVEVVEPEELREFMLSAARSVAALYEAEFAGV